MRSVFHAAVTVLLAVGGWIEARAQAPAKIEVLRTPTGIRFGLLGSKGKKPAPTLFILASSLEDSLGNDDYAKVGRLLLKNHFLCVAVDMPCHGLDQKPAEPAGLAGWRARLENGQDWVGTLTRNLSGVLDHLIRAGYTDPKKVAVAGTSRGGFMALHFAAVELRVRCVAAFAPVTDLRALTEFAGLEKDTRATALDLRRHADKLAGRSVWLCIGNNDERVGTDQAIALTRKIVAASVAAKRPADVELHVMPTIGHRIHATAHEEAAAWFAARLGLVGGKKTSVRALRTRHPPLVCSSIAVQIPNEPFLGMNRMVRPGYAALLKRSPVAESRLQTQLLQ